MAFYYGKIGLFKCNQGETLSVASFFQGGQTERGKRCRVDICDTIQQAMYKSSAKEASTLTVFVLRDDGWKHF